VKRVRTIAWCTLALGAVAISGCRLGYEELDLLSSGDMTTTGGKAASGGSAMTAAGNGPGSGAVASNGDGGHADLPTGGMDGSTGGTSAGEGGVTGGSSTGNSAGSNLGGGGTGGSSSACVPDATCSCDVFQGHEYRFCAVLTIREAGLAACQAANMGLIRVETPEENAWLMEQFVARGMFLGTGGSIVLLGGNDIQVEGTWTWDDGTLFWDNDAPVGDLYTNWGSPPKFGQDDCLGMRPRLQQRKRDHRLRDSLTAGRRAHGKVPPA
jgi:hypothetical protein